MSTFLKVAIVLLLTLPVGAYVAGTLVGPRTDDRTVDRPEGRSDRPAVVVRHDGSVSEAPSAPARPAETRSDDEDQRDDRDHEDDDREDGRDHDSDRDHEDEPDNGDDHRDEGD